MEAGALALVGRASKTPGRETYCKGVHGGSCCSLGGEDMLPVEGAQSLQDDVVAVAVVAAAAGGDGDV